MRIFIDGIDATRIEGAGPADDAVDVVALRQQKLRKIRPILARNPGNQALSSRVNPPLDKEGIIACFGLVCLPMT